MNAKIKAKDLPFFKGKNRLKEYGISWKKQVDILLLSNNWMFIQDCLFKTKEWEVKKYLIFSKHIIN